MVRCRSCVQARRSCTEISTSPDARALPVSETSSEENASGKIVTTSILTPRSLLVLRERRNQAGPIRDHDASAREVDLGDEGDHERHQRVAAVRRADLEEILCAVDHGGDLAERAAVEVLDGQTDQLVVVELVGVLR